MMMHELERRWFAAQSATRGLQAECDLLLEALKLAEAAWRRSCHQLAEFEALNDALESELAAFESPFSTDLHDAGRQVMSAA
jgi:hypothetical protein